MAGSMGLIWWEKKKEIKTRPSRSWLNRLAERKKYRFILRLEQITKQCARTGWGLWLRLRLLDNPSVIWPPGAEKSKKRIGLVLYRVYRITISTFSEYALG